MVDQARDRPRAHRAGTPRTERASRAPPPHPQGGDGVAAQGQPEAAAASLRPLSAQLQQRAAPRGPGTATAGQALHPLVPALSLTPQLAGIRGRGHRAPSAPQRRDQVEGGQSLCERRLFGASPSASSSKTSAPGRYSSDPSSSASSTTTRGGSTRPRYTCYLCPRSNRYPCARSHKGDSRIAPTGGEWSPTFVGMTDKGREGTGGNGGCDSPRGIEAPLRGAGCVKRSLPLAGSVGYSNRRLFCWRSLGRQGAAIPSGGRPHGEVAEPG